MDLVKEYNQQIKEAKAKTNEVIADIKRKSEQSIRQAEESLEKEVEKIAEVYKEKLIRQKNLKLLECARQVLIKGEKEFTHEGVHYVLDSKWSKGMCELECAFAHSDDSRGVCYRECLACTAEKYAENSYWDYKRGYSFTDEQITEMLVQNACDITVYDKQERFYVYITKASFPCKYEHFKNRIVNKPTIIFRRVEEKEKETTKKQNVEQEE
jgi:hypothetical protein